MYAKYGSPRGLKFSRKRKVNETRKLFQKLTIRTHQLKASDFGRKSLGIPILRVRFFGFLLVRVPPKPSHVFRLLYYGYFFPPSIEGRLQRRL